MNKALKSSARSSAIAILLAALVLLGGCAGEEGSDGTSSSSSSSSSSSGSYSSFEEVAEAFDASALDLGYSDRDQDATWDASEATFITLEGSTASVDGEGAEVSEDGTTVTITAAGTYVVSGTLDDGQLLVSAGEDDKVQIVLDGVSIHNEDGPAIYIDEADKCFITLAEGSENELSDGEDYELEEDSDEPYATLFSRADLTLNGSGALTVDANYRHGICSKDDLVITGGSYVVDAAEDALRGRDCVKILDGDFELTAGGDGIKSNNDGDPERGFVSIDGGSFSITAGDDGIQAETYLRIAGGTFDVAAEDDALHSNISGIVEGGDLSLSAGDDAFHTELELYIEDGAIDVSSCFEGLESEAIYIDGGTISIVSSDDALNASSADLTGDSDDEEDDESFWNSVVGGATTTTVAAASQVNEAQRNSGQPDSSFSEGLDSDGTMQSGATVADENCLIQINGGYIVLDASGDAIDSNGSVEITGGVVLVNGPSESMDGAFDYDLSATISGGEVIMVGSAGMAQNFTSGTQAFAFTTVSGSAGQTVAVVDSDGEVIISITATKSFGMVLVSSESFEEGGEYSLVIGGSLSEADENGYASSGTVSGGSTTSISASTTATSGLGGLGSDGNPLSAGQSGDVRVEHR